MKTRLGFVSNSSSSSFVVSLDRISAKDLAILMDYYNANGDCWTINIDKNRGIVRGYTTMDNNDLWDYLTDNGVNTALFVVDSDN